MAEAYRGLTIRFAADARSVLSTLRSMQKASANVNSELKLVQRALRLDPKNTVAAQRNIQLLAEQAGLARGQALDLKRSLELVGREKIDGVDMKTLAERTRNASSAAAITTAKFNELNNELAILNKREKQLNKIDNKTAAQAKELDVVINKQKELRAVLATVSEEQKKYKRVAEYISLGDKYQEQTAKAKAALKELNAATKAARPTAYTEGIKEAAAATDRLVASGEKLKQGVKVNPSSIKTAAEYIKNLQSQIKSAEVQTDLLNKEIKELSAKAGVKELANDFQKLESYERKATAGLEKWGAKLQTLDGRFNALESEILQTSEAITRLKAHGKSAWGLENKLKNLKAEQDQVTASVKRTEAAYKRYATAAQTATMARTVAADEAALAGVAAQAATAKTALGGYQKSWTKMASSIKSLGMSMYSTFTPMAFMVGTYAIQSAKEVDGAYRNMRKTVNGTEEQFVALKKAALEFGDTHFTTADQVLQIQALGGQLGIAVEDLEKFSEVVSNIDIATDLDAETTALKLGQLSNILKLTKDDWEGFSDALVRLGNNSPTLESSIMNVMSRISPMGAIVKMSADELLGWSTAVASTGQKAEAAGTAVARTMSQIEQSVAMGSESFGVFNDYLGMSYNAFMDLYNSDSAAAVNALGEAIMSSNEALEFFAASAEMSGDELMEAFEEDAAAAVDELVGSITDGTGRLEDFAAVAGMSVEAFAQLWDEDASRAMYKFIEGLKRIDEEGGSVDATLGNLKINSVRQKQALEGLTTTYDVLTDSLSMSYNAMNGVSDQWGATGDAAREAGRKAEGFSGTLQMLINNGQHLASEMGESLVPVLQEILSFVQDLTGKFESLTDEQKTLATMMAILPAASGPVITLFSSLIVLGGNMVRNFKEANSAFNVQTKMMRNAHGVFGKFSRGYLDTATAIRNYNAEQYNTGKSNYQMMQSGHKSIYVLKAQSAAFRVAAAAANFFKTALKTAAMAAAVMIAFKVIENIKTYAENLQKAEKATNGLSDTVSTVSYTMGGFAKQAEDSKKSLGKQVDGLEGAKSALKDYAEESQEALDAVSELNDRVVEVAKDKGISNARLLEYYETIEKYAGRASLSAEQFSELSIAIDGVNEIAGENLELIANEAGGFKIMKDEVSLAKEEVLKLVEAQRYLSQVEGYKTLLEDARAAQAEARESYQAAMAERDAIKAKQDEYIKYNELTGEVAQQFADEMAEANGKVEQAERIYDSATDAIDVFTENMIACESAARDTDGTLAKLMKNNDLQGFFNDAGVNIHDFALDLQDAKIDVTKFEKLSSSQIRRLSETYDGTFKSIEGLLGEYGFNIDTSAADTKRVVEEMVQSFETFGYSASHQLENTGLTIDGYLIALSEAGLATDDLKNLTQKDVEYIATVYGKDFPRAAEHARNLAAANRQSADESSEAAKKVEAAAKDVTSATNNVPRSVPTHFSSSGESAVKSAAARIRDEVNRIPSYKSITLDITAKGRAVVQKIKEMFNASGGVIPGHMAGGIVSGQILAQPTLTNIGWVGEAGAEAIIPLSNKHYVRPFAQAVASEMDNPGANTYNYYITLDYSANEDATTLARDLVRSVKRYQLAEGVQ